MVLNFQSSCSSLITLPKDPNLQNGTFESRLRGSGQGYTPVDNSYHIIYSWTAGPNLIIGNDCIQSMIDYTWYQIQPPNGLQTQLLNSRIRLYISRRLFK